MLLLVICLTAQKDNLLDYYEYDNLSSILHILHG